LRYADQCYRLSGGIFDITSGVLRRAWDFRRVPARLPTATELASAVSSIGWCDVEWGERAIRLPRAGMEIDLGGVGKEYAADRMATLCMEYGLQHALVNLGGDVRVPGPQQDGSSWHVGIRHPRRDGEVVATLEMAVGALATSGDYERFFDIGGVRYCHLLNARSGWPVRHWQSISVAAPLCIVAGSCSTIAMLLESAGEAFLASQGADYLAIAADGALTGTLVPTGER
jgi:FAD:protein FMN transferase